MSEYRERDAEAVAGNHAPNCVSAETGPSPPIPSYYDLARDYGLDDDFIIGPTPTIGGQVQQTVYEELQAYTTSDASPVGTDILRFWEVSL